MSSKKVNKVKKTENLKETKYEPEKKLSAMEEIGQYSKKEPEAITDVKEIGEVQTNQMKKK
jgi:hypothetical protein